MAKRRSLEIPSSDALQRMEEEFRRETPGPRSAVAPIAQIAAETAAIHDPRPPEARAEAARDRAEAAAFRDAQGRGLVMLDLLLDEIEPDALVRDRMVIDATELDELQLAIARNGLRLPIEVFPRPGESRPWGLLSGYRRLMAVRALRDLNRDGRYDRIKAVARDPQAMGGAFAAMVEENEIRATLSHYERGRIAVIAAQQGAFPNAEAAVDALFPVASKAKRSKIRSFALIFEELGDMLKFPEMLREKDGLRLAQALRDGAEAPLREALADHTPTSADDESALIATTLDTLAAPAPDPRKGGRPKRAPGPRAVASSGFVIEAQEDADGWVIRLGGPRRADRALVDELVRQLQYLLDKPD